MKILFIGLGGIGQRHLRNLYVKFGDSVSFLAYRVRNSRKTVTPTLTIDEGVDFIEKYRVKVFSNLYEAFLEAPDIAFICNPSSFHIPICIKAAKAGCHIFVEKPLSHLMDGVDELVELCRLKKLTTLVGFQLRFHPCYTLVKRLVEEEAIGKLLSIQAEVGEYMPGFHKYEDYRELYTSKKDLGGGVVLSQIHEIDYLYDLFGMPNKVFAFGGHMSSLEIDVEDTVDILMDTTFKGTNLPVSLHMDYIQQPPSRNCKIIGEDGKIIMDFVESKVVIERSEGKEVHSFVFERNDLFVKEIDHFFDCIFTKQQTIVPIEEGVNSLKIALRIKESMGST